MRALLTLIAITLLPFAQIQAQKSNNRLLFNYGIKAGFQAVTYNNPTFAIDGYRFNENNIESNEIGYTVNAFFRLTKQKFYLQTEAAFGITKHTFEFIEEGTSPITAINAPEYYLTTYCIQVPILLGYNFINYGNYRMGVFTGPRTKFILATRCKQEFSNFTYEDLREIMPRKTYYWELGLDIRIYNIFFDITYDYEFIDYKSTIISQQSGKEFHSQRNDNVLSFTVGFIF